MLLLRKILAGSLIAYGTGVILWLAHGFIQALIGSLLSSNRRKRDHGLDSDAKPTC
jgi:hypothetical protein